MDEEYIKTLEDAAAYAAAGVAAEISDLRARLEVKSE
jgi:hypothetical protein